MELWLRNYREDSNHNDTEMEEVFRLAIRDAINPEHDPEDEMEIEFGTYVYQYGKENLELKPWWMRRRLRYRQWATVLTGMNVFRLAYPGLPFDFIIYLYTDGDRERPWRFGWGCVGIPDRESRPQACNPIRDLGPNPNQKRQRLFLLHQSLNLPVSLFGQRGI